MRISDAVRNSMTFVTLVHALQIADDLASVGFSRKIGPGRSISQWIRWARNRTP